MEFDDLEILESKIIQALEKIEFLKKENNELKGNLEKLHSDYKNQSIALEEMTSRIKLVKDQGIEKEEIIRKKVSSLLDRLNNL